RPVNPAGRAEHAQGAAACFAGLCARTWTQDHRRIAFAAAGRSRTARRLPWPCHQRSMRHSGVPPLFEFTARNELQSGCDCQGRNVMKGLLRLLTVAALSLSASPTLQAQEILLGYLPSGAGPFATLSRTNDIAMQIAIDEINAAGGVGGKK